MFDTRLRSLHWTLPALLLALLLASPLRAAEDSPGPAPAELGEEPIAALGPLRYRPGRGLRVGDTGLVIGGFTNIKGEYTEESDGEFTVDRLNFFLIFDYFTRFRAVADLQLKDIFTVDEDRAGTGDFAFDVRRLFGDYTIADELHMRGGTFLTPIGYWNLILAPPLTWTTEAPLIDEETFFEQTTTGVMLHGSIGLGPGQLGYSAFTQFLHPLEDDPDLHPPDHTGGMQVTYDIFPTWSLGLSFQAAERNDEWSYLGGAHARLQSRRIELLAEALFQDGEDLEQFQWGTYLQGVLEVHRPFYVVSRFEHYNPSDQSAVNVYTIGGVWKPYPFMAVKVEYRVGDKKFDDEDLDGFFASFTTFF